MRTFKGLLLSLFIGSFLLILALSDVHPVVYKKGNRLNVLASSLNILSKPSISGKKIGNIPYGARITVLKKTQKAYTSEGIKGHWVKVKYGKRTGYIFDGYLTKLPAPPRNCKGLKHYADRKLGRIGKQRKVVFDGNRNSDAYHVIYWQKYRYNTILGEEEGYESFGTILSFKNISMEKAFLIGRLWVKGLKNKPFAVQSNGTVEIELKGKYCHSCNCGIRIEKDSKGLHLVHWSGC